MVPGRAPVVTKDRVDRKSRTLQPPHHGFESHGAKRQRKLAPLDPLTDSLGELLVENRQSSLSILAHRLDERDLSPAGRPAPQAHVTFIFTPFRKVRDQVDSDQAARGQYACDLAGQLREVSGSNERLEQT